MARKSASRRKFIQNSALATAGFYIFPRHVLGKGFTAPSDTLNVAGIGAEEKARGIWLNFSKPKKSISWPSVMLTTARV